MTTPREHADDKTEQTVTDALRRAFSLGKTYWQQAHSDFISQHVKADATRAKFQELCERTEDTIDTLRAQLAEAQAALKTVMRNAELSKEPCGSDPESPAAIRNGKFAGLASIAAQGLGMVRGPSLTKQLAEAQRDAERLDWIIEHRAYVVSDPDCCDGYWLNYARPDGTMWAQATEHETPRAAIDAAKGEKNGA